MQEAYYFSASFSFWRIDSKPSVSSRITEWLRTREGNSTGSGQYASPSVRFPVDLERYSRAVVFVNNWRRPPYANIVQWFVFLTCYILGRQPISCLSVTSSIWDCSIKWLRMSKIRIGYSAKFLKYVNLNSIVLFVRWRRVVVIDVQ